MTTFENIGSGPIHLPEEELHTSAAWLEIKTADEDIGEKTLEQLLLGISNVLQHIVPVYIMCDRNDVHVVSQIKAAHTGLPTIFYMIIIRAVSVWRRKSLNVFQTLMKRRNN